MFRVIPWFEYCLFCFFFQGIVKLDHPCIHVDFPIILCEVWKVALDWSCLKWSHRYSSQSKIQSSPQALRSSLNSSLETRRKTVILNWYIEWNVIHLNSTIVRGCPHFDIHIRSDGTGYVSTTQLICMQSSGIHRITSYFSRVVLQQKKILDMKRLVNAFCEMLSDTVSWYLHTLFEWICVRGIGDTHGRSCFVLSHLTLFQLPKLRPALVNIMYYK